MTHLNIPLKSGVQFTPSAEEQILILFENEKNKQLKLRLFVQGGSCAGFQYGINFDDKVCEDDFLLNEVLNGKKSSLDLLIDAVSIQYVDGAIIDFKEDVGRFSIRNPSVATRCAGCAGHHA